MEGEAKAGGKLLAAAALLVALAAFLAYAPTLGAAFLWDDEVVQAEQAPALDLKSALTSRPAVANLPVHFYRPAVLLSYLAEERLNRLLVGDPDKNPEGRLAPVYAHLPHAVTVLLHALASALLFLLSFQLLSPLADGRRGLCGALAAGLLFALHPVHAESAIMISGRSDSLAALFLFAALCAALRAKDAPGAAWPAVGGVFFLVALCAKEAAVAGLALLPLLLLATRGGGEKGGWRGALRFRALAPFGVAALIYAVMRLALAGATLGSSRGFSLGESAWRVLAALAWYARNSLIPWPVTPFAPELPGVAATIFFLAALCVAGYFTWRLWRKGSRLPLFAFALFIFPLLPALTVALREFADAPVAQRYLYIPSAGLALAVGWLVAHVRRQKPLVGTLALLLALSGALCVATSLAWRTNRDLWSALIKHDDIAGHALPWLNLAQTYMLPATLEEAERCYKRALNPGHPPDAEDRALAWNGLGGVAFNRAQLAFSSGRVREALPYLIQSEEGYTRALDERIEGYPIFHVNRAEALMQHAFLLRSQGGGWDGTLLFKAGQDLDAAARQLPGDPHVGMLLARLRSFRSGG